MKKSILFALAGLFVFASCTRDDDDDSNNAFPQEVVLDGTRYELGTTFMQHFSDIGINSENLDLNLITDGLTVHYDADNIPDSISGSGYLLYFEMFSSDSTFLSAGTYTNDTTLMVNTYSYADITHVVNGEEMGISDIINGEIKVVRNGNQYTITGSAKNADDNTDITFSYQGAIPIYDF